MSRRVGLRLRITALAAITVGVTLAVGAFVLVVVLRSHLDDAASTAAELRARDVAGLAEADALPRRLALPGEESAFVQVVDEGGLVIASTENIDGEHAVSTVRPNRDDRLLFTATIEPLDNAQAMRVAVLDATTRDGVVTVYAGESLRDVDETTSAVTLLLTLGVPLLALVVAGVTWWAVGRTLRPVREITNTMSVITTTDLHQRVPVPTVQDEIGELATTVNHTLERLDYSVETQRRFVADASHELRGPLAALRADLEISVTHPDRTDWTEVARDTLGDVERLEHLTDDLLLLAKLDDHQHRPFQVVDFASIATDAVATIRRQDLAVTTAGLDARAHVDGDPEQPQRMLRNLVHNAETHAGACVAVSLTTDGRSVRLVVGDDGPGIPAEDRTRVFERFVRLDAARTRDTGGTGLGLAIVNDVVTNHGGHVTVTDDELGGAAFVVEIPSTSHVQA